MKYLYSSLKGASGSPLWSTREFESPGLCLNKNGSLEKLKEFTPFEEPSIWIIKKLKQIFLNEKMFEFKKMIEFIKWEE